jgi:hypothetical protein
MSMDMQIENFTTALALAQSIVGLKKEPIAIIICVI